MISQLLKVNHIASVLNSNQIGEFLTRDEINVLQRAVTFTQFNNIAIAAENSVGTYLFLDDVALSETLLLLIENIVSKRHVQLTSDVIVQFRGLILYYAQVNNLPMVCLLLISMEFLHATAEDVAEGRVFVNRQLRSENLYGFLNPLVANDNADEQLYVITSSIYVQSYLAIFENRRKAL